MGGWLAFPTPPRVPQGLLSRHARVKVLLGQFGRDQKQIRANIWCAARWVMGF
jgi:hypothetical protein